MANHLWSKQGSKKLRESVLAFTVGNDYAFDTTLLPYDIRATIAHVEGLKKIGILTAGELKMLVGGLKKLASLWELGKIQVSPEDEDCHTVIENYLTSRCGSVGKKIHTGRSRNDQILTALRLYMKEGLAKSIKKTKLLTKTFRMKAAQFRGAAMPGYTHMQRAMPSTADLWLESFAAALTDDLVLMHAAARVVDQCPLGSVVGYGEHTLGLDRKYTSEKLGFARVQKNPLYAAMSRGKFELLILQALQGPLYAIGKFAADGMLFSTKEFGFLTLPSGFTTGSSAMPQKRNYDVLELIRAHASAHAGKVATLAGVIDALPSGYHRDLQLTKKIFMECVADALSVIDVSILVVGELVLDRAKMSEAVTPELHATEEAYTLVKGKRMPFRDAYLLVAKKYENGKGN